MGVDFQDYDNDGWEDIHLTGISGETFPLFRNDSRTRPGTFVEATARAASAGCRHGCRAGARSSSRRRQRCRQGSLHRELASERSDRTLEATGWQQANSLFMNDGRGRFRDATVESVSARPWLCIAAAASPTSMPTDVPTSWSWSSRPARAVAQREPRQQLVADAHLTGTRSNRDGIGARVIVNDQVRVMTTAAGYASSSDAGVHFGLGSATAPVTVRVEWPSG
jgi:hypothetical protein